MLNTLAREFAVCDQWFSSMPGPTWPNRFFMLAAPRAGWTAARASSTSSPPTTIEGYRFENGKIFDLLDQHCIEWRIYEGDEFPVSFALERHEPERAAGPISTSTSSPTTCRSVIRTEVRLHRTQYGKDDVRT